MTASPENSASRRFEEFFPLPDLDSLLEHIRWMADRSETKTSQTQMAEYLSQPRQQIYQSTVSRMLHGHRQVTYEEVMRLWNWFMGKQSQFDFAIKVKDLVEPSHRLIIATLDDPLESVANKMLKNGFSQIPIFASDKSRNCYGIITDLGVLEAVKRYGNEKAKEMRITELEDLIVKVPRIDENEKVWRIAYILEFVYALLVLDRHGNVCNILTRNDLLKLAVATTDYRRERKEAI
ncbi:MAG: CBS domain-containing protein [Candidatus Heimdallarchaeota archaeon]